MKPSLRFFIILVALLWCAAILAFPLLLRGGAPGLAGAIYLFFSKICHQDPLRSFALLGVPLPVCSRCTAIYFGLLIGALCSPLTHRTLQKSVWLLLIALGICAADWGLNVVGVWANTFLSRALTGGFLGISIGWCAASMLHHSEEPNEEVRSKCG